MFLPVVRRTVVSVASFVSWAVFLSGGGAPARAALPTAVPTTAVFQKPLVFEPRGEAAYIARGDGFAMQAQSDGALLSLRDAKAHQALLGVRWQGANPRARLRA